MKLAISNIAWTNEEELEVAELLKKLEVRYIEIAPTKKWDNPTIAPIDQLKEYKAFWQSYGIEVVAFQSMLFNRPDLKLFESQENTNDTLEYLKKFVEVAGTLKAGVMVFGSPKNRQRGELSIEQASEIAVAFFDAIGKVAKEQGTIFCIEPNASDYACDFITTAIQGIEIVKAVNNQGFGLHLDIACMTLAGDNISESIRNSSPYLKHFHISAPFLEQVDESNGIDYLSAAKALKQIHYDRFVSIEMKPSTPGTNLAKVERAVRFSQQVFET